MNGKIVLINQKNGLAALITENDDYTSFEPLGHIIELGDNITGNLESLGGETWYNETQNEHIEVFVEDIYGSKETALRVIS